MRVLEFHSVSLPTQGGIDGEGERERGGDNENRNRGRVSLPANGIEQYRLILFMFLQIKHFSLGLSRSLSRGWVQMLANKWAWPKRAAAVLDELQCQYALVD